MKKTEKGAEAVKATMDMKAMVKVASLIAEYQKQRDAWIAGDEKLDAAIFAGKASATLTKYSKARDKFGFAAAEALVALREYGVKGKDIDKADKVDAFGHGLFDGWADYYYPAA
jgi:hypothetical protein